MTVKLANYTTEISAAKSVLQIQQLLQEHGAKSILIEYDKMVPVALAFVIPTRHGNLPFRLPVKIQNVNVVLKRMKTRNSYNPNQEEIDYRKAQNVTWRNIYYWLRSQLALIEIDQVTIDQVFLPYLRQNGEKCLYEVMIERQFLLEKGQGDK